MKYIPFDQTEATVATEADIAVPRSVQWSQRLSNDMVEHLMELEQRERQSISFDPDKELRIVCEVHIKNVLGTTFENELMEASKAVPRNEGETLETWASNLVDAVLSILSTTNNQKPESQTLSCELRKVAETAWILTTDKVSDIFPKWNVTVQFESVLNKVLKDIVTAFVSEKEGSENGKNGNGRTKKDCQEIGEGQENSPPIDSSDEKKFKSYSLFDLLDANPKLAEAMEKEPVTAATIIDAYNKTLSAETPSSGDSGLDRLEQAVGVLEKIERVQDLVAPSVSRTSGTNVDWKDILFILTEGLDLLQVVAKQDENDEIIESSSETQNSATNVRLVSPFERKAENIETNMPTQMDGVTEDLEDDHESNPWGSALKEGDDALLLNKQIEVTSRYIQVHETLFHLCSKESIPTKGLAMSPCGNFAEQKYDLLNSLLRSVTAFFREDSYILLTLADSRYRAKAQESNGMLIDEKAQSSPEWKQKEGKRSLDLSCRPGLKLGARLLQMCHHLLVELCNDFCLMPGKQVDMLIIRYFTLLKTLEPPSVNLPASSITEDSSESGEEKAVCSIFYLQPVHLLTALDPNARLFSKLIRLVPPPQMLEYFKFTNLLHDIFSNSNPHEDDDTLSSKQRKSSTSDSSSWSKLNETLGSGQQNDGSKTAKSGLTGAGFGAQHHVIYIVLEPHREGSRKGLQIQDLCHSHFSWSLTALKSCLYALQSHFPQESTVHPLSRQLLRMDNISTTEVQPAEYGGLSVRRFECIPLREMGGEDNIALIMTFARVWRMGIKSTDPNMLDSHLVDVCHDGVWRVIYSTLMLHETVFSAGMVHFFAVSTTCGLCHAIGVNPLLGTTSSLLAVFRLCGRVLATDPYHTTIPAEASWLQINTYEGIVFENMQRVLTFVLNDKSTLESLRVSSLSRRERALRALTDIILPMQWMRPRLDLGQQFSPLTAQWVLMLQVYMQISFTLGTHLESLLILARVIGKVPEGWWLIEHALKGRRDADSARALKGRVPLLFNEWMAGAISNDFSHSGDISILPMLCCVMASTSDILYHTDQLLQRAAAHLKSSYSISAQGKRDLNHIINLALSSFDSHFLVQNEEIGETALLLIQDMRYRRCLTYNLDTLCLLAHRKLVPLVVEGNEVSNDVDAAMDCEDEPKNGRKASYKNFLTGMTTFDLLPTFKPRADKRKVDESRTTMVDGELSEFDRSFWETASRKINHFFLESTLTTGNVESASIGQADATKFLYRAYLSEGTKRNATEAICVDWFKVCFKAIVTGEDSNSYERLLKSLKTEAGILFLWQRLHPNQISRKRYLFTVAAGVHRVLGRESTETANALNTVCQSPTWTFIPTWVQQNFVGIVPFSEAVYILYMCLVNGVDYIVYYSVAILRHVKTKIVEAAASSKLIHSSDWSETQTFSAVENEDYVRGLCKKHRPLVLELMAAATS